MNSGGRDLLSSTLPPPLLLSSPSSALGHLTKRTAQAHLSMDPSVVIPASKLQLCPLPSPSLVAHFPFSFEITSLPPVSFPFVKLYKNTHS